MDSFQLLFNDCLKFTLGDTGAALDTYSLVDGMDFLDLAGNAVNRADACAESTTYTFFRNDNDFQEVRTYAGRALSYRQHELCTHRQRYS